MLLLVVDANILIAAFLKAATTRKLLLDERLGLLAPEHVLVEARKVLGKPRVLKRLTLTAGQFAELFTLLTSRIRVVPKDEYKDRLPEALRLAPHEEDAPYLALGLASRASIWSNDGNLRDEQDNVVVYTTTELLERMKHLQPPPAPGNPK